MEWAVGIDPSLTRTGVFAIGVGGTVDKDRLEWTHFGSKPKGDSGLSCRFWRYSDLAKQLRSWITETCVEGVRIAAIEGYAFGKSFATRPTIELGCVYRTVLLQVCKEVVEVPPSSAKKFSTKNGAASKQQVQERIEMEFGIDLPNDDVADAAACAWVAAVCGQLMGPGFTEQEEIAKKVAESV